MEVKSEDPKKALRERIWEVMEREQLVPYPLPLTGRIPNFYNSKSAAYKLCSTGEFRSATTIKIHPSLNAEPLRHLALKFGKKVLTPPLPGHDFLYYLLDPACIEPAFHKFAASKRGFNKLGIRCKLSEIPPVDLVVVASVACTLQGARVGKGKGYGEVEYGILREMGVVDDNVTIATVVHDAQVVEGSCLPLESLSCHDVPVDIICTPTKVIRTMTSVPKPGGIFWELISEVMMDDIGALKELKSLKQI
ncbi:uncharacterized protein LOC134815687 [Bolinopsis microptera]|uniref:uncharacterized protein LOC134815687 n=1 Tax=Bolinopsis microptera TaxID=2820187 RepID=UPI00307A7944